MNKTVEKVLLEHVAINDVPSKRKSAEKVVKPKKERSPEQVEADKKRMSLVRSKKVPKVV